MNKPKVLYIHHSKDFSSNSVYLSNNFLSANRSLFGAQEMDSWAGYRIVSQRFNTYRLQISTNLSALQLTLPTGESRKPIKLNFPTSIRAKLNQDYIRTLLRFSDTSFALYSDSGLREIIENVVQEFDISVVWVDTQFYVPAIPAEISTLVRSVNFEPFHVLREDPSVFRFLRVLGKVVSETRTVRNREVIAISPRDAYLYERLARRPINFVPLRQLSFLLNQAPGWKLSSRKEMQPYFYFAGSNFDVKHNKENLLFLLNQVAPALSKISNEVFILIFGHRFPQHLKLPQNVKYMHFREDYFDYITHSLGSIVPNPGGAGMQSKIFEPLCLGIPLIANSEALAGFPFNSVTHFWKGGNLNEIIESIREILNNSSSTNMKVAASYDLVNKLFQMEAIKNATYSFFPKYA